MTLLRAAARTMLATYFISSGIKALRNPDALVPAAEPLTDKLVPLVKQYAPAQVAGYVPEDARSLVRLNGGTQVLGGLALATGKGRRVGALLLAASLVPSTIAKYPFWSESDAEAKALAKNNFLKNVSLLGGVLLAARDTEGQPGIAWRAQKGGQHLARDTRKVASKLTKSSSGFGDTASDFAGEAVAGGAALLTAVAATGRKARKEAGKQFAEAQKAAAKAAKQAKKDAPKQLKAARKLAGEQAEAARKAAVVARKEGRKQLKLVRKQAKKVRGNITLGEN